MKELRKSLSESAFFETITTRKRSGIRVYFRDIIPDSIVKVATKINGTVKIYETASDPELAQLCYIEKGELVLMAPPNDGDITIFFSKEHSVFHPDNGKRISTSAFADTWDTGLHYQGFCNFDEVDLSFEDAILMELREGIYSGRIISGKTEKQWLDIDGNPTSNQVSTDLLDAMKFNHAKGHLFDIQAQLRNVGDIFFFLSDKITKKPRNVLQFEGVNNQDHVTTGNAAQHGIMMVVNHNGVRSKMRAGCMDISNETEDKDIYESVVLENAYPITCETALNGRTVLAAVFIPYKISGKLNTRDVKYFKSVFYASRRGRVSIYKLPNTSYITKGAGLPLVDTLFLAGGDWSPVTDSSLWFIDNSQSGSTAPRLITGFDISTSRKVDGGGGGTVATADKIECNFPDVDELNLKGTHGEVFLVIGEGVGNTADMQMDVLSMGEGV